MSSEPSERAKLWYADLLGRDDHPSRPFDEPRDVLCAFDAGYSEGEKKGTAVGYLKALREIPLVSTLRSDGDRTMILLDKTWLDRRIREAEENAK